MKERLEGVCYQFRNAIDSIRKEGKFYTTSLSFDFPSGTCGDTSELLGRFLLEKFGFNCFYVCGEYYENWGDHYTLKTHAWLEHKDYRIDILQINLKRSMIRFLWSRSMLYIRSTKNLIVV